VGSLLSGAVYLMAGAPPTCTRVRAFSACLSDGLFGWYDRGTCCLLGRWVAVGGSLQLLLLDR
jgi:hypothetical protein